MRESSARIEGQRLSRCGATLKDILTRFGRIALRRNGEFKAHFYLYSGSSAARPLARAREAREGIYSVFDGMGRDADNAGAAYVSQWYARNCYIFSNILSVLSPADRAVVIIGQGHEYLLREFVRLNLNLRDVDPLQYLNT